MIGTGLDSRAGIALAIGFKIYDLFKWVVAAAIVLLVIASAGTAVIGPWLIWYTVWVCDGNLTGRLRRRHIRNAFVAWLIVAISATAAVIWPGPHIWIVAAMIYFGMLVSVVLDHQTI